MHNHNWLEWHAVGGKHYRKQTYIIFYERYCNHCNKCQEEIMVWVQR